MTRCSYHDTVVFLLIPPLELKMSCVMYQDQVASEGQFLEIKSAYSWVGCLNNMTVQEYQSRESIVPENYMRGGLRLRFISKLFKKESVS